MNNANITAVRILADTEAIFRPIRDWGGDFPAVVYFARQAFFDHGIVWRSAEAVDAARKATQRDLEALADDGLIELHRTAGRDSSVKLTSLGDHHARALLESPGLPESLAVVRTLEDLTAGGHGIEHVGRRWISEELLAGCRWGDPKGDGRGDNLFGKLQATLMPAIVRGWVVSNSDLHRHVYYSLEDAGRGAVNDEPKKLPKPDPLADAVYTARFYEAAALLGASNSPVSGELGYVPMPCSCGRAADGK